MDPDAALANLRAAIQSVMQTMDDSATDRESFNANVIDLVDAAGSLDDWLAKGGFLPAEWDRNR